MSLEITGKLVEILPEQSGQGRNGTWKKQAFVIETTDQYPKKVCFNLWGDRISMLEGLSSGHTIKVAFDLESREYNGRWYTDAKAWKVDSQEQSPASKVEDTGTTSPDDPFPDEMMSSGGNDDDLPF